MYSGIACALSSHYLISAPLKDPCHTAIEVYMFLKGMLAAISFTHISIARFFFATDILANHFLQLPF